MNTEEYFELSRDLEGHHAIFYKIWEMGKPVFDSSIPTACVRFNKEGEFFQFCFNREFWDRLTPYERQFVICHECLHVILNHGVRINGTKEHLRCNKSLDVVVNHSLVNNFGFDRKLIRDADEYCWTDTIFPGQQIPDNECFEYYFSKMKPQESMHIQLVDMHNGLSDLPKEIIDKLNESLSNEEKESIKDLIERNFESIPGTTAGGLWQFAVVSNVKKKKKWETVIKKWASRYDGYKEVEQWTRINRRFSAINKDLILPTDMEIEHDVEDRIKVWFFQDTSGSCSGFINRFFTAAMSLPTNRFDVKMHCFDTQVYETDLKSKKLYGFGGTSFSCIERYIQKNSKVNDYPKAVWVVSDGYGDNVYPQKPKNWYWFLSTNYTNCIPKECNIYQLKDFE